MKPKIVEGAFTFTPASGAVRAEMLRSEDLE